MALTVEEKLARLKDYEGWPTFTDSQKVFLAAMAEGLPAAEAFKRAYPETKTGGLIFATQQMMCRVGIKKALSIIEIETNKAAVSRKEALDILSARLRKCDEDETLVKLLGLYSKLSGWDKPKDPEPTEDVSLDQLVAAMEKKRKKQ